MVERSEGGLYLYYDGALVIEVDVRRDSPERLDMVARAVTYRGERDVTCAGSSRRERTR